MPVLRRRDPQGADRLDARLAPEVDARRQAETMSADDMLAADIDAAHLLAEHEAACAEIHRLRDRVRVLTTALTEAVEDIGHWGGYASAYFQDRWDLAGDLARYREILTPEGDHRP